MLAATLVPLIATAMPAPSAVATSISIADPRRVSIQQFLSRTRQYHWRPERHPHGR